MGGVTRRQLVARGLMGLGAAALAACGRPAHSPGPSTTSQAAVPPPIVLYWNKPLDPSVQSALAQGLQAALPTVRLEAGPVPHGSVIRWWMVVDELVIGTPPDLSEGLRQINLDPNVLAPGAYDALRPGRRAPRHARRPGTIRGRVRPRRPGGRLSPVIKDAGAVASYWAQSGIGDPVRPTVFPTRGRPPRRRPCARACPASRSAAWRIRPACPRLGRPSRSS